MSFREVAKIGRPGPGVKKGSGLYKLVSKNNSVNNSGRIEILSEIAFADPVIQLSGPVSFKLIYNTFYKATYIDPSPTFNRLRLSSGGSTGDLLSETKDHTDDVSNCSDSPGLPRLTIAGSFVGNTNSYSDGRFSFQSDVGGSVGRTNCGRNFDIELIFSLGTREIVAQNLEQSNGVTFTLEKL